MSPILTGRYDTAAAGESGTVSVRDAIRTVGTRGTGENAPVALRAPSASSPEKTPAKTDAHV
jgi:hypothetical protein